MKQSYPNHYTMKKNRIIKLNRIKFKCEICGGKARYIHHIDETKYNHELSNLMAVCPKCHVKLHPKRGRPKKYKDGSTYYERNWKKRKLYYEANKEKQIEYHKNYVVKNRNKVRAYRKTYMLIYATKNQDRLKAYQKEYRRKKKLLKNP